VGGRRQCDCASACKPSTMVLCCWHTRPLQVGAEAALLRLLERACLALAPQQGRMQGGCGQCPGMEVSASPTCSSDEGSSVCPLEAVDVQGGAMEVEEALPGGRGSCEDTPDPPREALPAAHAACKALLNIIADDASSCGAGCSSCAQVDDGVEEYGNHPRHACSQAGTLPEWASKGSLCAQVTALVDGLRSLLQAGAVTDTELGALLQALQQRALSTPCGVL
jgi:hypothetical protein